MAIGRIRVMSDKGNPIANDLLVLREEFDDWAVLFDPDSGDAFGLSPVGVFVWKRLDGMHSEIDILRELHEDCEDVPKDAVDHIREFVDQLAQRGFVGYGVTKE
jgi:SynChlorMet cassette protein ScmD